MFCISFNWLTLLISSSARKREHRKLPPFLSRSLSLYLLNSQSGSQALRLSEREQSDWVMSQMPVVWSHGLMLCQTSKPLAHSTRFLSQQRSIFPTWAFYSFAVSSPPPSTSLVCFDLSHLPVLFLQSVCSLSLHFPNTCVFHFFAILFKRYCGERYTSAGNTHPPSLLPFLSFLNCSLSKKVASRCVLNYCDTHRQVHYLYGESAFLKG